jgi:hypothetical protein
MRKLTRALPVALAVSVAVRCFAFAFSPAQAQQNVSPRAAAAESHEGMAISAEPWLDSTQYKQPFPKHSPFAAGVVAVHVAFRNDSGEAMKIGLNRIRLNIRVDENTQQLEPLSSEQVADAAMRPKAKDPTAHRRLPVPLPAGSGVKKPNDKNWTEVQTEAQNAAVPTSVIAPHSTVQGLLYFDLQGQLDLFNSAHLYLPDVIIMGKNQSLTYFEIDLSRPAG